MILRRFMKHVTDQNWFAVGLDVIVVIVGIFLGLQVTEWSDNREIKQKESAYLERLHLEMDSLLVQNEQTMELYNYYLTKLSEASEAITIGSEDIMLDGEHCDAIQVSNIYYTQGISIPTLRELITSGQLSILEDLELQLAIANYLIAIDKAEDALDNLRADKNDLTMKFPDLIAVDFKDGGPSVFDARSVSCDFEAMGQSRAFKNDLTTNYVRMLSFINETKQLFEMQSIILERLNEMLGNSS